VPTSSADAKTKLDILAHCLRLDSDYVSDVSTHLQLADFASWGWICWDTAWRDLEAIKK
jgi:hypothetical protein